MNSIKKMPLFYKIYFSLLIVFAVCLCVFSAWLISFIADYNKGIPETVSQEFYEDTFLNTDSKKIIEMSGIEKSEFETDTQLEEYIKAQFSGNLSFTSVSSTQSDDRRYIVKSDDYKIASFTLSQDKNGDSYPSGISLHLPKRKDVTVKVFGSSSLFINGKKVSDEYLEEVSPYKYEYILPKEVSAPQWKTYIIPDLTAEPVITATDRNSKDVVFTADENGILTECIVYDTPDEEIAQRMINASKEYAKCMQNDAPKSAVYPYIEKGTELYNSLRYVETGFVWDHSGYDFEDVKLSEFLRYDENTVSARISFTHVLKMYGRQDYRDMIDITFFARNIDGQYMIFALKNE